MENHYQLWKRNVTEQDEGSNPKAIVYVYWSDSTRDIICRKRKIIDEYRARLSEESDFLACRFEY